MKKYNTYMWQLEKYVESVKVVHMFFNISRKYKTNACSLPILKNSYTFYLHLFHIPI